MSKQKKPKNKLGLVIATPKEALFMKVRDNLKQRINAYTDEIIVAKEQLKQALDIIEGEKNAS